MKTLAILALLCSSALCTQIDWPNVKPLLEYSAFTGEAPETFVIGGQAPRMNQFPFLAALVSQMPFGEALCGGSLISRRAVLTSATCISGAQSTVVILGGHDLNNNLERYQARFRVQSTNYRIHPNFVRNARSSTFDVGIVRLSFEIAFFNPGVRSINIATASNLNSPSYMMGFGRAQTNSLSNAYSIRYAQVTFVNNCSRQNLAFPVLPQHVCTAGNNGRSLCSGSLGGPLISLTNDGAEQIGIASFYSRNCTRNDPSVFTRTFDADIRGWINANSN